MLHLRRIKISQMNKKETSTLKEKIIQLEKKANYEYKSDQHTWTGLSGSHVRRTGQDSCLWLKKERDSKSRTLGLTPSPVLSGCIIVYVTFNVLLIVSLCFGSSAIKKIRNTMLISLQKKLTHKTCVTDPKYNKSSKIVATIIIK